MKLGNILKAILPVAQTSAIAVSQSAAGAQSGALVRQVLIAGGTYLAAKGYIGNDQVDPAVGAVAVLGSIIYGQLKTRKEHKEKVVLADAAPSVVGYVKPD